jgi:DNA polymerase-3 subunit gamma/tau
VRNAAPSSGRAAARAAAAAAAGARAAGGRAAATPAAPKQPAWSDGSPTEEAPYDPEYDGQGYEGFDPGDEPLDDVIDEKTARESSEQQAMRLLQEAFGAEKIGES